ncbi:cytochrome P450 [Nonomuraea sp. 10N515B]|uniref:cytochrome P450 n=1 Tax=Nonomuraea sp. 10N515B TaxID=3457422 RepID=UPI003FCC294E
MPIRTLAEPSELETLNLADPGTHAEYDLSEVWSWLRANEPIYWHPPVDAAPGFWVVTRFKDVAAIYFDNKRFTSEKGNVLTTLLQGGDSAAGVMMAVTDGRRHTEIRRILLRAFSPRALGGVVENLEQLSRSLLREIVSAGGGDFAGEVAAHIPLATICDLLGVPSSDRGSLLEWTKAALSADGPGQSAADIWQARNDILGYFEVLARQRRTRPGQDAVSVLASSLINGRPLSMEEVVSNCYSLILGGDETSRLSMSSAVLAFIEHPGQWEAWKRGEAATAPAVEEVLRWTTPAMHFGRTALEDVEVGGRLIRAGDIVTLWNNSANRDEETFADPFRFDLSRSPNKHISFGYGPHFCLGAYLGRAEIAALLTGLRELVTELEVSGEPRWIYSNLLSGMSSLPVRLS